MVIIIQKQFYLYCGLEISKTEFSYIINRFLNENIEYVKSSIGLFSKEGNKFVLYNKEGSRIYEADKMVPECWVQSVY